MTDRKLVTVDDAQDTLHSAETSATDTGQWSNNYVSQLAHTVIAQAEQIEKLHDAVDGLKYMAESSMHIADTTATAAGLSHLIDADGDGDWQTIWERVWGKLEEHKAQAAQVKRLQAALRMIDDHEQIDFLIEEKYLTKEDMG